MGQKAASKKTAETQAPTPFEHDRTGIARVAVIDLQSVAAYSPSRQIEEEELPPGERKQNGESHLAFDMRTWRKKAHYQADGLVVIPGIAFQRALVAAAQLRGEKVKGRGSMIFKQHFMSAVFPNGSAVLTPHLRAQDLAHERVMCDPSGKKGTAGGARVPRYFPLIPQWSARLEFFVTHPAITREIFQAHLVDAGLYIGVGRWRPQNGGLHGRFAITSLTLSDR